MRRTLTAKVGRGFDEPLVAEVPLVLAEGDIVATELIESGLRKRREEEGVVPRSLRVFGIGF